MRTIALSLISALLIVSFVFISTADSEKVKALKALKHSTTVGLDISAHDEIKNQVYSYISRELRSLGDVKLVENDPNWTIQVVAMQIENKLKVKTGVAVSVVIIKRRYVVKTLLYFCENFLEISPQELMEKKGIDLEKSFTILTDSLKDIRGHSLRVGSTEDMQSICQGIVADFDAEHLKEDREVFKKMLEDFTSQYKKDSAAKESENKPKTD